MSYNDLLVRDGCQYFSSCFSCGLPACKDEMVPLFHQAHPRTAITPTEMGRIMHAESPRFSARGKNYPSKQSIIHAEAAIMRAVAAQRGIHYQTVWKAWQEARRLHLPVTRVDVADIARRITAGESKVAICAALHISDRLYTAARRQAIDDGLLVISPSQTRVTDTQIREGIRAGLSDYAIARTHGVAHQSINRRARRFRAELSSPSIPLTHSSRVPVPSA